MRHGRVSYVNGGRVDPPSRARCNCPDLAAPACPRHSAFTYAQLGSTHRRHPAGVAA